MYVGTQRRGLGDSIFGADILGGANAGAVGAVTAIKSGSAVTGAGTALLAAAPFTGPAAPFVAIAGAATELLGAIGIGRGCGQSCILASQYADKAETLLRQNLDTYQALPQPRTQSQQAAALQIYDQIWSGLQQACSNPQLGSAGQRCITDRQAGACKWKDSSGNCFNWFSGYRDPIAHDPNVVPDAQANLPGSVGSLLAGGSGVSLGGLALLAGLVIAGVYLS